MNCILGYNAVQSVESQPMFRRNMSPPSLRLKSEVSKKPEGRSTCYLLHIGFLLGLFFDPEDGGDMFPRNVGLFFNWLHSVISQKIKLFRSTYDRSVVPLRSGWRAPLAWHTRLYDPVKSIVSEHSSSLGHSLQLRDTSILSAKSRYKWTVTSGRRQRSSSIPITQTTRGPSEQVIEASRYSLDEQRNRFLRIYHNLGGLYNLYLTRILQKLPIWGFDNGPFQVFHPFTSSSTCFVFLQFLPLWHFLQLDFIGLLFHLFNYIISSWHRKPAVMQPLPLALPPQFIFLPSRWR
jgi:hypothetical protein